MQKNFYRQFLPAIFVLSALLLANSIQTRAASVFENRKPGPAVPLIRGPYLQMATSHSMTIVWNTSAPSSSIIEWAPLGTTNYKAKLYAMKLSRHVVTVKGLKPGATYRYRIGSNGRLLAESTLMATPPATQGFRFALWGDSGEGTSWQKRVATQIEKSKPDLLLHAGDLVYERGEQSLFNQRFFNIYKTTLAHAPFYGALGNHDIVTRNGAPFLENFIFPRNAPKGLQSERNYSFNYGAAHFVVLDTNLNEAKLKKYVAPWLDADLKASHATWKFVVFHHPAYSSGVHGDTSRVRRALVPVFTRNHVDVVWSGHDHDYERFKPINGVRFIVSGEGGAGLYKRRTYRAITQVFSNSKHSFSQVTVEVAKGRSTLRVRQIDDRGELVDSWQVQKKW